MGYLFLMVPLVTLSLQLHAPGVDAQGYRGAPGVQNVKKATVGTFNTYLLRGAPGFQERKERLAQTVSYTM